MSKISIPFLAIHQWKIENPLQCPYRIYKESLFQRGNLYAKTFCKIDPNMLCPNFDKFPSNCPLNEFDTDNFVHTLMGNTFQCEKAKTCDKITDVNGQKHCECSLECFKQEKNEREN